MAHARRRHWLRGIALFPYMVWSHRLFARHQQPAKPNFQVGIASALSRRPYPWHLQPRPVQPHTGALQEALAISRAGSRGH